MKSYVRSVPNYRRKIEIGFLLQIAGPNKSLYTREKIGGISKVEWDTILLNTKRICCCVIKFKIILRL